VGREVGGGFGRRLVDAHENGALYSHSNNTVNR